MKQHCLIVLFVIVSSDLFSQLSFVNSTPNEIYLAVHYYNLADWKTTGWYRIQPGDTLEKFRIINNRFYYFYAKSKDKTWNGNDVNCWIHDTKAFDIDSKEDYTGINGYRVVGLKKIDTRNKSKLVINLELRSDFQIQIEQYLSRVDKDPIEGLYTISDSVFIDYPSYYLFHTDTEDHKDHWAKVAIIKDTTSLTWNYLELVLEAPGFKEGDLRGEYLRTKQNPLLFVSKQKLSRNGQSDTFVVEFIPEEDRVYGEYKRKDGSTIYAVKRSYLKYYPVK